MRNDAAPGRFGIERKDRIACAARLERADALQMLAFEEQLRADLGIDRRARHHRRAVDVRADARRRLPDRCEIGQIQRRGGNRHQLPDSLCALGKNISFHDAGFTLIEPTLYMKSTYFITLFGVVV